MTKKPTDKQVAEAALAQLTKSVKRTTPPRQGAELRDQQLRSLDTYKNPRPSKETGSESSPASTTLMEKLWVMMAGLYGHKWVSSYGPSDIKVDEKGNPRPDSGIWGKALSGITGQQIASGIRLCTARTGDQAAWPPSAPEFREMCLAGVSSLGIPSPDAAWAEAVEASSSPTLWTYSHPIVQESGRVTSWYNIRHGVPKAETVRHRFLKVYAELTQRLVRGESLIDSQLLLANELRKGEMDIADAKAELELKNRLIKQGIKDKSPEQLREDMRKKLGIRR